MYLGVSFEPAASRKCFAVAVRPPALPHIENYHTILVFQFIPFFWTQLQVEIQDFRRNYDQDSLDGTTLESNPTAEFLKWLEYAHAAPAPHWLEITAMTLATSDSSGRVTARIVLLKTVDASGFTFFTNYRSDKAKQLLANPYAALVFYWPHIERQVRVEGLVAFTDSALSDKYFHARPRGSQISAVISPQSQPLLDREQLEKNAEELAERYSGDQVIPRPDYWGGYLLKPDRVEFWQGRPNRLHDRFLYTKNEDKPTERWSISRLAP